MGFFDDLKDAYNESASNATTHFHSTCQRCKKWCRQDQKGITITFKPVAGSIQICSNCNAQMRFNGSNWQWIN